MGLKRPQLDEPVSGAIGRLGISSERPLLLIFEQPINHAPEEVPLGAVMLIKQSLETIISEFLLSKTSFQTQEGG